jgi:hypothetical protein
VNLSCNNFYLTLIYDIVLMCINYVLTSMRITQVDPDDEPLSKIILSQIQAERIFHFIVTRRHGKNEQQEHGVYRRVEE